jgi:Zn-dependent peptidase ImmA (M78 family)/transcriptional regulator with XRE-family HTH domain
VVTGKAVAANRIDINPERLRWARDAMNHDADALAKAAGVHAQRITEWESGAATPTMRQLEKVAAKLLRDPAFFVVDGVPDEEPALASFRRVFDAPNAAPSPALLGEVAVARARRTDLLELWEDAGIEPEPVSLRLAPHVGVATAAQSIRDWASVSFEQQMDAASDYAHLRLWIDAVEARDVLVFHTSSVDVAEFRGLALHLAPAPIVLLNGADGVSARIFTLLHEVCHLALGENDWAKSGLEPDVESGGDDAIETFCNRVAAELLVPGGPLADCAADLAPVGTAQISQIAGTFNVSRAVCAVRLKQLDLIDATLLASVLSQSRSPKSKGGGGDFYRLRVRNVGRRYTADVLDALYSGQISQHDAATMLGARRSHGLDAMRSALAGA